MSLDRRTFLKHTGAGTAALSLISVLPSTVAAASGGRRKLPRSTPEEQGISSQALLAFLAAVGSSKHEFHSFMMQRHGHVIAEGWWSPYEAASPHMLYSLSKSFTSTAVGLAAAEGKLAVTDKVTSFFPGELPEVASENLAALRIKDLLTMSVGHAEDSTGSLWPQQNWVKTFLALPIKYPPGTQFLYNSGATYMLSAIVQKVTGQPLLDFLTPRLFEPLGISGMTWETCPRGINTGGWGLKLPTEAIAKFGQLYLQKGSWEGRQILPAEWVAEATTFKIQQPGQDLDKLKQQSDWHQGYCYQFWRCRHNAFRGDGAFGQFCIVMPDQDAVIAITSESPSMQGELDLIYEHLLPAMKAAPLPADRKSQKELKEKLAALSLSPPAGRVASPVAARISGKSFKIEANDAGVESVSFGFEKNHSQFTLTDRSGPHSVKFGLQKWVRGETTMPGTPPKLTQGDLGPKSKVAGSGTWKDENTFEMTWQFYETPHHDTVTCRFEGEKVRIEFLNSIAAMSPGRKDKRLPLEGRVVA